MPIEHEILEHARDAPSLEAFRERALAAASADLDADVALFATVDAGRPDWSSLGMGPVQARLARSWSHYGREIAAVQQAAREAGVATDRRVLGGGLERTRLFREIMAPLGGQESLILVPELRGRKIGFLMLGRTHRRRFSDAELARARLLGPATAVSWVALAATCPGPSSPQALGLTGRKRELLEYLELGYTTREIAMACGTSTFTVRNQLSALYRALGVSNRAEAAGLRARRT
jgi:DNA-binding CsgD family transcriptional regulator